MFFKTFSYLKFLLKSTNQHGIHSPFVFDFVTKGLYIKTNKNSVSNKFSELNSYSKKEQKILQKIVNYFNIDKITLSNKTLSNSLDNKYKNLILNNIKEIKNTNPTSCKSNHIVVFKDIYQNKENNSKWLKIIQQKEATVTIDLFYFGLIFYRTEQAKEHFVIRV